MANNTAGPEAIRVWIAITDYRCSEGVLNKYNLLVMIEKYRLS